MRKVAFGILFLIAPLLMATLPALAQQPTTIYHGETPGQAVERIRSQASDDLGGAIAELTQFLVAHPFEVEATRLLGDLYYRKADLASAERVYRSLLVRQPNDRETWNRVGAILAAQDRTDEAITAFERSLPETYGYTSLVELHRRRGDLAEFERSVESEARQHPLDVRVLQNYGSVLRAMRRYPESLIAYKRALDISPNRCSTLNDLANVYLDMTQVSAAVPLLEKCLSLEPNNYVSLVNIGESNIELGQYEKAKGFLEKARGVRSDRPEAYVDLGYIEDVAQRWRPAVALYQRAISVDPLARDAYVNLGYDYNEQKLFAQAEAAFIKGLSVAPRDGRLRYMLGVTYNQQGKVALARAQYQRAIETSDEPIVADAAKRELAHLPNP